MLNQTRHLAGTSCGDMGVVRRARPKSRDFERDPHLSRLQTSSPEMRISFEHRIPRFQERSAELQIPRLRSG